VFLSFGLVASLNVDDDILLTAHRGVYTDAPENSLSAFKAAVDIGIPWAELDVQLSKDGVVMVMHDQDLKRMSGLNRRVRDMTMTEMREIELPWNTAPTHRGEHVPTLEEIIDAVKGHPLKIMIEIKIYRGDDVGRLVDAIVDLIQRKDFADQCMVISMSYESLQLTRKRSPKLRLAYLVAESVGNLMRLNVDELSVRFPLATPLLIAEARAWDKPVLAWTVEDPRMMVRLWNRGVANVLTNNAKAMMARREQVRAMSDVERLLLRARYLLGG